MADHNHTALVTGAAGGMGRAISRRLAEDGFSVVMTDIDEDAVRTAAREVGHGARALCADISKDEDRAMLIDAAGPIFALINNAGIFDVAPIVDLTPDDLRRMYEINTVALFDLSRRAALQMKATGGRIVNLASRVALGSPSVAHYAATKGAVVTLTRCMALEFAADQILVNAVGPGIIDTPMLDRWTAEERARMASYQPLGKIGRPEDVANVISMLASPRTDYITGQTIFVDGGRSVGGLNV